MAVTTEDLVARLQQAVTAANANARRGGASEDQINDAMSTLTRQLAYLYWSALVSVDRREPA